jgi:hypothetical protein
MTTRTATAQVSVLGRSACPVRDRPPDTPELGSASNVTCYDWLRTTGCYLMDFEGGTLSEDALEAFGDPASWSGAE